MVHSDGPSLNQNRKNSVLGHHVKLEFVKVFSSWVKEKDSVNQKTIIEWLQSQKSEIKNDLRSLQD